jgi:hypothetical protein
LCRNICNSPWPVYFPLVLPFEGYCYGLWTTQKEKITIIRIRWRVPVSAFGTYVFVSYLLRVPLFWMYSTNCELFVC